MITSKNQYDGKYFRYLLLSASIAIFLVVVMGYIVRVTDSTQACPDWPTCYGQWSLPGDLPAQIQFFHRVLSILSGLLIMLAALVAFMKYRKIRIIPISLGVATGLMGAQILLGAMTALGTASAEVRSLHLGLALVTMSLVLFVTVKMFYRSKGYNNDNLVYRSDFAHLTVVTSIATLLLMVSGAYVAYSGVGMACSGWPLCNGDVFPSTGAAWIVMTHRILTLIVSILIIRLYILAWKSQWSQRVVLAATTSVGFLFVAQVFVGALKVSRVFPIDLVGLHAVTSAALWGSLVILISAVGLIPQHSSDEDVVERRVDHRQRVKDFIVLTKPIIVILLLVTTYAGMVVGGKKIPSLPLTFWTILGGALAAGGASALNQYIDRDLDKNMQRTQKRPLAAGRVTPAEGLAFGIALCLAAFYLMAGFVNLLAAVLCLAGMVYYVLLYSILLKRATVQNIVIGGGAGAIPPLVGWAAATGSLNIPSLFLFAIVFFWTPPHFWALALVRRNDYARAGIPMMPVVRGEKATRSQIFIYTVELVGLTVLMPLLHLTGSVFLISAILLGGWLILAAWKVLKKGGNKTAWMMYRYSSMYLALLFVALVIDVLI